jgi:hypothetical protein
LRLWQKSQSTPIGCGEIGSLLVWRSFDGAGVQQEEAESYGIGMGTQSEDWLGGAMPYPAAYSPPSNFPTNASPYCAPSSSNTNPKPPSYTHDYLRHAQEDRVTRRANEHHEASPNGTPRWTLIVIDILTILVNLLLFFNVDNEIAEVAQDAAAQGEAIDIVLFETIGRILYGRTMMVGVVFILMGAGVYQFPVAAPAIGLGLYVLGLHVLRVVMYLTLNPMAMISPFGIAVKFVIIGTLVKAINSGVYYRR